MKRKRLISWVLTLAMVLSLLQTAAVPAMAAENGTATQASSGEVDSYVDKWPSALTAKVTDIELTSTITPNNGLTIASGQTLIVHGNGAISGATIGYIFEVQDGGHLVLDGIDIKDNTQLGVWGAMIVKSGGLLDLGYNDQRVRTAPSITNNTTRKVTSEWTGATLVEAGTKRNLTIGETATVRLNAEVKKPIGLTYGGTVYAPVSLIQGGRYTLQDSDITTGKVTSDDSTYKLVLYNDQIVMQKAKQRMLYWYVNRTFNMSDNGTSNGTNSWVNSIAQHQMDDVWKKIPDLDVVLVAPNSWSQYKGLDQYTTDEIMSFDMIEICAPRQALADADVAKILAYLNNGGRVYIQTESGNWPNLNTGVQKVIKQLNGEFTMLTAVGQNNAHYSTIKTDTEVAQKLMSGVSTWKLSFAGVIDTQGATGVTVLMTAPSYNIVKNSDGTNSYTTQVDANAVFAVDQYAGNDGYDNKFGRITVMSDADAWVSNSAGPAINSMIAFAKNMLTDSMENRLKVATGENPNASKKYEATTTTTTTTTTTVTSYNTPTAALVKAVDGNTVTLLTKSNPEVTAVSEELLFGNATLTYEDESNYAGNSIHAVTDGVYVDITKTGEVNLRSGTVSVTPASKDYVLTIGGTGLNTDGSAITGGIQIQSEQAYTLNAADENSPITEANHGTASITAKTAGDTFTVTYPGGETVKYTAKTDGETIYLGKYAVEYIGLDNNMTRQYDDSDPRSHAHHGLDFEQVFSANAGFELKGESFDVYTYDSDRTNHTTYTFKKDTVNSNNTQTVYISDQLTLDQKQPKIVIKQVHQQIGNGAALRNGDVTVTVHDVRENLVVTQKGDATEDINPILYVVGVGVKADGSEEELWSYTTQRSGKDGQTSKSVDGWPWQNWKVKGVKTASGTETDYAAGTITSWEDGNLTIPATASETAKFDVDLTKKDQVIRFEYEWDMVEVTIKARLGDGTSSTPFPNFTAQTTEVQRDVTSTILAPTIAGYQPSQTSETITPKKNAAGQYESTEVTFYYTMTSSTVIYRAVDEQGHVLSEGDGTQKVNQGDTIFTDSKYAPALAGYQVKPQAGTATANGQTVTTYDGVNQVTVTWVYEPKTRDVEIHMVEYDTSKPGNRGAELRTDTKSYAKSPVGFTLNLTAPAISGYTVKTVTGDTEISSGKTVFVEDDNSNDPIAVYFYYEENQTDDAKITVQLWDQVNDEEIWSYTMPGQNGEKQLVRVPTVKGYVSDAGNKATSIAPDDIINQEWGTGTVRFLYSPNTVTVKVQLVDSTKATSDADYELNSKLQNYKGTYTVVKGESVDIVAPSIYGYVLKDSTQSIYTVTVGKDETQAEITQKIEYEPVSDQMVNIQVTGKVDGGADLYTYTVQVAAGSKAYTLDVKEKIPGYKLSGATVDGATKFSDIKNGQLTVTVPEKRQGQQHVNVVFLYSSNMAPVTINSYYDGVTPQQKVYNSFTIQAEIGTQFTFGQPALDGYNTVRSAPQNATITVTGSNDHIDFYYTKASGNVTYRAVDADNNNTVLAQVTKKLTSGEAVAVTDAAASQTFGTIPYYTLTASSGAAVDADGKTVTSYDGRTDVTVTYTYTRNTRSVKVVKYDANTNQAIPNSEETIPDLPAGKHTTLNPTVPSGYTQVGSNPEYFVTDDLNQTVTVYYRHTDPATVTVKLVTEENGVQTVFNSYTITGTVGVEMTIKPADYIGYEFDGTPEEKANGVKVTPAADGTSEVILKYKLKTNTVTVQLQDAAGQDISAKVSGFQTTLAVKEGDGLVVTAPNIAGYALKDGVAPVVSLTASVIQNEPAKRTITFTYDTVAAESFVKHTIIFELDGHTLYEHEKLVPKGNGTHVNYDETSISYVVPGFTLQEITYANAQGQNIGKDGVTDAIDATITYSFREDAAQILIKHVDASGNVLTKADGSQVPNQMLTGYRNGQQDVVVVAPALDGFVLVGALTQKIGSLQAGTNEVSFQYTTPGKVTLTLKEKTADGSDKVIRVLSPSSTMTYTAGTDDLNLESYGYDYSANDTQNVFNQDGKLEITNDLLTNGANYDIYYTKQVRDVTYVLIDKDKLGSTSPDAASGDQIIQQDTVTGDARVGESYVAAARQLTGYTLADDLTKVIGEVQAGQDALKVYFLYTKKTSGDVRVIFQKEDDKSTLFTYTATAAVGEDFTASAPDTWENGKYTRQGDATQTIQVQTTNRDLVFVYESNYVTVTTASKAGTSTTTRDSVTVAKNGQLTLTPPNLRGYELVGITATGHTLTGGGEDSFPAGWNEQTGTLTLTGLTADTTVLYHYKSIEESLEKYQATITVTDKYQDLYTIGTWTQTVTKNKQAAIAPKQYGAYILTGYRVEGDPNVTPVSEADAATFKLSHSFAADTTVTFIYASKDGSIVVPGQNGTIGDEDDVTVQPNGNDRPSYVTDDQPEKSSVKVPDGGSVVTPDGVIIPPNGSIVKPDGTIVVPDGNGNYDDIYPTTTPDKGYITVTYKANNGTRDKDVKQIGQGSVTLATDTAALGFTTPQNKTFSRWTTDENGYQAVTDAAVTTDTTLYAQWEETDYDPDKSVQITFDPNTGDATKTQLIGARSGAITGKLTRNTFTVRGWEFGGWNEEKAGNGTAYTDEQTVRFETGGTLTLYAQWYKLNDDGSITVPGKDGNPNTAGDNATAKGSGTNNPTRNEATGNIEIPSGGSVTIEDETISLPDGGILKPDGTIIINRPDTDGDGKSDGTIEITPPDGNPTVKDPDGSTDADAKVVTVTYKSNNGKNETIKSYGVENEEIQILSNTFSYAGHQFESWKADGGTTYQAGNTLKLTADLELTAQWKTSNPDVDKPKVDQDGNIVIPGKDGKNDTEDDVIVKPVEDQDGNKKPTGKIDDTTGKVTITNPDGADISIPGENPPATREDIKVPDGTIIDPDGTIHLPEDKDGKDSDGGKIPGGSTIEPDGTITYRYTVKYVDKAGKEIFNDTYEMVKAGAKITIHAKAKTGYTASPETCTITGGQGEYTITFTYTQGSTSGGGGGGGTVIIRDTPQKPTIIVDENTKYTLSKDGTSASFTTSEEYEVHSITVNGVEKGGADAITGLKTGDVVVVSSICYLDVIKEAQSYKLVARSKQIKRKNGLHPVKVKITWYDENGKELKLDGYEIERSRKRYGGYQLRFKTDREVYYNTYIQDGAKYYYRVRGYIVFKGVKYYTNWSKKAWRTVKM